MKKKVSVIIIAIFFSIIFSINIQISKGLPRRYATYCMDKTHEQIVFSDGTIGVGNCEISNGIQTICHEVHPCNLILDKCAIPCNNELDVGKKIEKCNPDDDTKYLEYICNADGLWGIKYKQCPSDTGIPIKCGLKSEWKCGAGEIECVEDCTDTDAGINFAKKGQINSPSQQAREDYCIDKNTLREYFCIQTDDSANPKYKEYDYIDYDCTCVDGECIESKAIYDSFGRYRLSRFQRKGTPSPSEYYRVPKQYEVLFFHNGIDLDKDIYSDAFNILKKEGYRIQEFVFNMNEYDFWKFQQYWNTAEGGIVIWSTHGIPGLVEIARFDDEYFLERFKKMINRAGFREGYDYNVLPSVRRALGLLWKYTATYDVYLTNKGMEKLQKEKDLVFFIPCYGSTLKDYVNSNIVYFVNMRNYNLVTILSGKKVFMGNVHELITTMTEYMSGKGGTHYLPSTYAFEKVPHLRLLTLGLEGEINDFGGNDHTMPKDRDVVLNPYIKETSFQEDFGHIVFGSKMLPRIHNSKSPLVFLSEKENCYDAYIVEDSVLWAKPNPEKPEELIPSDVDLVFTVEWGKASNPSQPCYAKLILNSPYLQSSDSLNFYLNGKMYSHPECIDTKEAIAEEGRACWPLDKELRKGDVDCLWISNGKDGTPKRKAIPCLTA